MTDRPAPLAVAVASAWGEHRSGPTPRELTDWLLDREDDDDWMVVSRLPYRRLTHLLLRRTDDGAIEVVRFDRGNAPRMTTVDDMATAAGLATGFAARRRRWNAGFDWATSDPVTVTELSELEESIGSEIDQGYAEYGELSETAADVLAEPDDIEQHHVDAVLVALWHTRLAEQSSWPERTDPDRITDAFTALAAEGITAMEHFACCLRCGTGEIGGESSPGDTGYVFFHHQDTERAALDGELMVAFGSHDGDREVTAEVGRRAVAALTAQGLTVEWDGDVSQRISVTGLNWQKRLEDV